MPRNQIWMPNFAKRLSLLTHFAKTGSNHTNIKNFDAATYVIDYGGYVAGNGDLLDIIGHYRLALKFEKKKKTCLKDVEKMKSRTPARQ